MKIFFIIPEVTIILTIFIILIINIFTKQNKKIIYQIIKYNIIAIIIVLLVSLQYTNILMLNKIASLDFFNIFIKTIILFFSLIILILSKNIILKNNIYNIEYFTLYLSIILSTMIITSSYSFLILYLGLELLSFSLYSIILTNKNNICIEATIKFFIIGSISSFLFLFGVSLIYGTSGTIDFHLINKSILENQIFSNTSLQIGLCLIIFGLIFKLGAVPFHFWIPDTYQASSNTILIIISTIPKFAALSMSYRILSDTFFNLNNELEILFIIIGIISLFIGNIFALSQKNIRRLLGYSTVSNSGFIFFSFLSSDINDFTFVCFYMIIYCISILGIFGIILTINNKNFDYTYNFKNLYKISPILCITLTIFIFSLAGIPPTAGFFAKFFILKNIMSYGYFELSIYILIMSIISLFYYLNIIKYIYFSKSEKKFKIKISKTNTIILSINSIIIIILGINPNILMYFCYLI